VAMLKLICAAAFWAELSLLDVLSSLKMEVTFTPIIETDTTIARKTDVHINSSHFIRSDILLFTFSFLSFDELLINTFPLLFDLQISYV
jgi:hypothetical protein